MGVAMGCEGNSTSYISQTLQNLGIFTRYLEPVADQLLLVLTWLQCGIALKKCLWVLHPLTVLTSLKC